MSCKCKQCSKGLVSCSSDVVLEHYKTYHLSIYVDNKDVIRQHPRAFVYNDNDTTIVGNTNIHNQPTIVDITRNQNMYKLENMLKEKPQVDTYREKKPFICCCCKSQYVKGKWLHFSIARKTTVCSQCYRIAREHIKKEQGPKLTPIPTPMGGMTRSRYQKHNTTTDREYWSNNIDY